MKGIDIFCRSQAATGICNISMDEASSSSSSSSCPSSAILHGGGSRSPAIDRCNPIITDSRRTAKPLPPSKPPAAIPKPHKNRHKKKNQKPPSSSKENADEPKKVDANHGGVAVRKSWSCTKPGDFISPPGSTRYLLSEKILFNALSDLDPARKLFPAETSVLKAVEADESSDAKPPSTDQVVVLRVSLHCRGCERKMRKHISRMEGVRSFNIDFAAKKVTVTGKITPLEVLSSISKVKNAQLWPPTISSSSSSSSTSKLLPVNLSNPELKINDELSRGGGGGGAWIMDKGAVVGITS